ncbi:MAG: DNA pilot protein [Microvirus sp.]|nr:MAG: DNA pilot protein [Microvirus sp.]
MAFLGSIGKALGLGSTSSVLGSIAGPLISGGLSLIGGSQANASSAKSVQSQQDFQADQSSTAYQRAMADMKAAGLNPMLAYSQGGASTPSGANYTAQDAISPAVSSARAQFKTRAEVQNMNASYQQIESATRLNEATTAKTKAETAATLATLPMKELKNQIPSLANPALETVKQYLYHPTSAKALASDAALTVSSKASSFGSSIRSLYQQLLKYGHSIPDYQTLKKQGRSTTSQTPYPQLLPPPVNYK